MRRLASSWLRYFQPGAWFQPRHLLITVPPRYKKGNLLIVKIENVIIFIYKPRPIDFPKKVELK